MWQVELRALLHALGRGARRCWQAALVLTCFHVDRDALQTPEGREVEWCLVCRGVLYDGAVRE